MTFDCSSIAPIFTVPTVSEGLADLGGRLPKASTCAEDVFLEYAQCHPVISLAQFESLALTLQAQALVDNDWPPYSSNPPPPEKLKVPENPKWTNAQCWPAPSSQIRGDAQ
jgi:hypothetical protein